MCPTHVSTPAGVHEQPDCARQLVEFMNVPQGKAMPLHSPLQSVLSQQSPPSLHTPSQQMPGFVPEGSVHDSLSGRLLHRSTFIA